MNFELIKSQILERINFIEEYSQYVSVKKSGNQYKCLCPFHRENTPSMSIHPVKGVYYCFGCQAHGDLFAFIQNFTGKSFLEVLQDFAYRFNIKMEIDNNYEQIVSINTKFVEFCSSNLAKNKLVLTYLEKRGLDKEAIDRFKIGYIDKEPPVTISPEDGIKAGIYSEAKRCIFWERLIFPLFDTRGDCIAVAGRGKKGIQPKYLNSYNNGIYIKSNYLYGRQLAPTAITKHKFCYIVEGYFDVCVLQSRGIDNVVGLCCTSISVNQIDWIKTKAKEVVFCLDNDVAGNLATIKNSIECIKNGLHVSIIQIDADPDEYVLKHGADNFIGLTRINFVSYVLNSSQDRSDKLKLIREILPYFETLDKWEAIRITASFFSIPESEIENKVSEKKAIFKQSEVETEQEKLMRILLNHDIIFRPEEKYFKPELWRVFRGENLTPNELTERYKLELKGYESENPELDANQCYEKIKKEYILNMSKQLYKELSVSEPEKLAKKLHELRV